MLAWPLAQSYRIGEGEEEGGGEGGGEGGEEGDGEGG